MYNIILDICVRGILNYTMTCFECTKLRACSVHLHNNIIMYIRTCMYPMQVRMPQLFMDFTAFLCWSVPWANHKVDFVNVEKQHIYVDISTFKLHRVCTSGIYIHVHVHVYMFEHLVYTKLGLEEC